MNYNPSITPLLLLLAMLILFIWDKFRYDMVAMAGLLVAVVLKIVDVNEAFTGFGHPAVILVAAALVISHGLNSSGAIQNLLGTIPLGDKPLFVQLFVICGITAILSGFINNVGAVALMLPFVITLAYKNKRSVKLYLMPLAFSSLLGGLITLIGTPPNIIISSYRNSLPNKNAFAMFDFLPVGIALTIVGVIFLALLGKYFIKRSKETPTLLEEHTHEYLTEIKLVSESSCIGSTLKNLAEEYEDISFLGISNDKNGIRIPRGNYKLKEHDILVIEASAEELEHIIKSTKADLHASNGEQEDKEDTELLTIEVIIPSMSESLNKTAMSLDIRWKYNVNILAIARSGHRINKRLAEVIFNVGDILILQGKTDDVTHLVTEMEWVYLAKKDFNFKTVESVFLPIALFVLAITLNYFNIIDITVGLLACALAYVLLNYVKKEEIYEVVEWPVILLLACLIPIGEGLEKAGSLDLISRFLIDLTHGHSPQFAMGIFMVVTILLTNVINNAAAAVVMAPVAISLATKLNVSADSFLIATAVASSCAFMTPIGHQSNALVMQPGGYSFKEYFYLGAPLSIIVVVISVPLITYFWPL